MVNTFLHITDHTAMQPSLAGEKGDGIPYNPASASPATDF